MRVWLAPSAYSPHLGGVEELTAKLAQQLRRRGHEVLVVTNRHPQQLPAAEQIDGVPVRRLPYRTPGRRPDRALQYRLSHTRVLRALHAIGRPPDVIHVICASNQIAPLLGFARSRRSAYVLTTQGETEMDAGRLYQRSPTMRRVLREVAERADALTACSRWTAATAARIAPAFSRAEIIPNGVDPEDWVSTGPPPERSAVCAWGRHVPQKGLDLLIAAFTHVRAQVPDATLEIGGSGPDTETLHALAGPGVSFAGPLDRAGVRDLLARSRVAVIPSRIEPFGIVAVEALAAGRGIVYADRGGLPEATGGLGFAVDPEATHQLAKTIVTALRNPVDEDPLRARGRELAWSHICQQYETTYQHALRRSGRSGKAFDG